MRKRADTGGGGGRLADAAVALLLAVGTVNVFMLGFRPAATPLELLRDVPSFESFYFGGPPAHHPFAPWLLLRLNEALFGGRSLYGAHVLFNALCLAALNLFYLAALAPQLRVLTRHRRSSLLLLNLLIGAALFVVRPHDLPLLFLFAVGVYCAERDLLAETGAITVLASTFSDAALLIPLYWFARAAMRDVPAVAKPTSESGWSQREIIVMLDLGDPDELARAPLPDRLRAAVPGAATLFACWLVPFVASRLAFPGAESPLSALHAPASGSLPGAIAGFALAAAVAVLSGVGSKKTGAAHLALFALGTGIPMLLYSALTTSPVEIRVLLPHLLVLVLLHHRQAAA